MSVDRYGVHFTADAEFRDLLEAARALASHRLPAGNMAELMKLALKAFIRDAEKKRFAVGHKPRRAAKGGKAPAGAAHLPSPGECDVRSRHVPAAVAREIFERDQGRCSFVAADGRRCDSRVFLELDHEEPWALGGPGTTVNLRLRCRAHNLLHARRYFGKAYIRTALVRSRFKSENSRANATSTLLFADAWARSALTLAGFLTGALVGLFAAPDIQRDLQVFGVDQRSFGPAAVVILLAGVAGSLLIRRHIARSAFASRPPAARAARRLSGARARAAERARPVVM